MRSGKPPWRHAVYGVHLESDWRLLHQEPAKSGRAADIKLMLASPARLAQARVQAAMVPSSADWFQYGRLPDGSTYLRWKGLFEFVVSSDGSRIFGAQLSGATRESFQTYALGHVLSFALLKKGIEPLHSTAVAIDGSAVAFVGDCGYGKSSLGAAFLQAGYRILTDDLLVVRASRGRLMAFSGPARLKLVPEIARPLLGSHVRGTPMVPNSHKLLVPLAPRQSCPGSLPLGRIYVLSPPPAGKDSDRPRIRAISRREAFLELTRNTFNTIVAEPERLKSQFLTATRLARAVPVKRLSYPRRLEMIPAVREAILADLQKN